MHFKFFLGFAFVLTVGLALYVKTDSSSLSPPVTSKSPVKNEAQYASPAEGEAVVAEEVKKEPSTDEKIKSNSEDDEFVADTHYVLAEMENLGYLLPSQQEIYKDYDDETLVALMKMDDVVAAYQYVENGKDLKDWCERSGSAIRHGVTSNAINFLVGCARSDIYDARRIGPEIAEDAKLRAMAIIEYATYRGDFSHMVRNLHKNVELSPEIIAQVSDIAQSIFDDVNRYRIAQGLEPFEKRNRGRMLKQRLQYHKNVGTLDELDDWKRSLLGLPPQVQPGSG